MGAMMTMDREQLHQWVARAQPGEDVVYSTGVRPGDGIGAAARALHESGVVALRSKRFGAGFRFIAVRLADLRPARRSAGFAPRGRFVAASDDAKRTTQMVLRVLTRAARRGDPCPTNAEIARIVGLKDAVAASYRMRRLVKAGAIVVDAPSPIERRVVTIVATGQQTRRAVL